MASLHHSFIDTVDRPPHLRSSHQFSRSEAQIFWRGDLRHLYQSKKIANRRPELLHFRHTRCCLVIGVPAVLITAAKSQDPPPLFLSHESLRKIHRTREIRAAQEAFMPQLNKSISESMGPLRRSQKDKLKKIYERIRKTNTRFAKATPEKKRVMIARDILFQLDLRRLVPSSTYFDQDDATNASRINTGAEVRDVFKQMPECNVCGIGSCFVAAIDRADDLTCKKAIDRGGFAARSMQVAYLVKLGIFTSDHLDSIECCFESDQKNQKRRLRRMMERIIERKGVMEKNMFYDLYPGAQRD